ncbi:MAG: type II toxin-antitoxin system Phd/YefM family antitoxin [Candidatus Viridilinea halotolerans]|uniref:Antitoxin n=1 Tax=Candidatus Viridilinea halotolerans TaxID=2491704 RepID=A0A426TQD8_9CHLR|nr:MAG: type II toxin-antitoxin system Phd/YefM family antitoxin [Candidatus Viridilinea halotolerans]
MKTKWIASTEAQNNFGRLLDDVIQNKTRYIIKRRNISQALLISIVDLEHLLAGNEAERQQVAKIIHEAKPAYTIGSVLVEDGEQG